jgi:hypothetical protein
MSVVPYVRFQELQDRRRQIVAELLQRDPPPPVIDVEVQPAPAGAAPVQPLKANS